MPDTDASLQDRLLRSLDRASRAEAALARHFLDHADSLPFETAASVARKVGVSEATVGRYCRALGYRHFKALKAALQAEAGPRPWLIGDRLQAFAAGGSAEQARALERELATVVANHETAARPEFHRAAQRIATRSQVFVAGFQTERGHAAYLAHLLQYLRPGVQLVDLAAGSFAEVLTAPPEAACLVIFEARRYARQARDLAAEARKAGIPVTLITDPYCRWGQGLATEVFAVPVDHAQFWDATSGFASLTALLVNAVFQALGPGVEARMTRIAGLYDRFSGHLGGGRGGEL